MQLPEVPVERFPEVSALTGYTHGFFRRVPGLNVTFERAESMRLLKEPHTRALEIVCSVKRYFGTAEQIHGNEVACIGNAAEDFPPPFPLRGVDGLLTARKDVLLGIYVADCAAVYLVDRKHRAAGLVHSGKKGTEGAIVSRAISLMNSQFGVPPQDLLIQISPCIRPPLYEWNFAEEIVRQAKEAGVERVYDCGVCTGSDLDAYYSYRMEKGKTGRMLAFLGLV